MTIRTKRENSKRAWSRLDRQLFRLNLTLYQSEPGEPSSAKRRSIVKTSRRQAV